MEEFVARGFAATRLDDIARRAGVAKGTLYVHFKDKESMFEELVRTAIVPVIERMPPAPVPGVTIRATLEQFAAAFIKEIAGTRRADIVRLIMAEGPRFPALADFYYREVVSRGMALIRGLIELAIRRGEINDTGLVKFPQIVVAPALVAVIWDSLFARHAPLDATAMIAAQLDLIFGKERRP